jgi:hypothetical protein
MKHLENCIDETVLMIEYVVHLYVIKAYGIQY